ncbi:hypothetical protein [Streptomyces sp. NPDC005262]|uniref:hypothetical protein n=1 Tax=Streptomyces sp. NPDC005262 TaxID=3364710 RepID=UPI0036A15054
MLSQKISNRKSVRAGITGVVAATVAGLALVALPGQASAAADGGVQPPGPTTTAANYVAYLDGRALAGDAEAADIATQFKALSFEDQFRFLTLISDSNTTQAYTQAVSELGDEAADLPPTEGSSTKMLGAGHAVETVTETGEAAPLAPQAQKNTVMAAAASYRDMWASYSVYDTVFGIRVTKVTIRTNYQVNGTDTTKVYPGSASHYNYVPAASFSNTAVSEWISSPPADNAQSETVWTATWKGGLGSWSARERVWGDYRGFVGGYLK